VTGGVHGLGAAVCRALAADGLDVAVNYRHSAGAAEALCAELGRLGGRAIALAGDVSDPHAAAALVAQTEDRLGRLDVLVCAAGPFRAQRVRVAEADVEAAAWQALSPGNVAGAIACVAAALPGMRERRHGRVVTFGMDRVGEAAPWPGRAAYAAAKAALWSYTQSVAREEACHGVTANMVAPGNIVDPFKEGTIAQARAHADHPAAAPIGRPGSGEDVARVVRFLAALDSDFVTGSVIYLTGAEAVVDRPWS